jgi:DnaJ-class molecular chaperone
MGRGDEVGTLPAFPAPVPTFGSDRICSECRGRGLTTVVNLPPYRRPATDGEIRLAGTGKGPARACPACAGEGLTHG